jgi:hypothetical protein
MSITVRSQHVGGFHGRLPHHPLAEIDAYEPKCTGKRTCRPERVVLVVEGGGDTSEGTEAGVQMVAGLKVVYRKATEITFLGYKVYTHP